MRGGDSVFLGRGPHHSRSDGLRLWVFAASGFFPCGALPQPRIRAPSPPSSRSVSRRAAKNAKGAEAMGIGYWVLAVCSFAHSHFLPSGLPCEGRRVVAASSRRSISPNDYSIFHRTKNLYFTEQLSRISPNGLTGTPAKVSHNTRKEDGIVVCPISALKP